MNFASLPLNVVETVDRRVLGAFRFVDSVTRLPIAAPAKLEMRGGILTGMPGKPVLQVDTVRILQNRRGIHVIFRAPLFDAYADAFENPQPPAETENGPLRLRLAVTEIAEPYLPQEFEFDLPRSLDPKVSGSVFNPFDVALFRAPNAPVQDGWAVLRVAITRTGASPADPLPGVLLRVFRSPRSDEDSPIGAGMTDWRERRRGEALVALSGIQRFRPGSGNNVIETDQAIDFEATRDSEFTGAVGQFPNVSRLIAGTGDKLIRPPNQPPVSELKIVRPTGPVRVRAGQEDVVSLSMP